MSRGEVLLHEKVFEFSGNTQSWQTWHFLYYLNLKTKVDKVISHIYLDSKYYDKCKFTLKFIQLVTNPNLFPLEVVQKCKHVNIVLRKTRLMFYQCTKEMSV